MSQLVDYAGRMVNHVATFYQPGEQHLAVKVYQALGCRVSDTTFGQGNEGLVIHVEPDQDDLVNNVIYAAEVTPAQWQLEQELRGALGEKKHWPGPSPLTAHSAKTSPSRSPTLGFATPPSRNWSGR